MMIKKSVLVLLSFLAFANTSPSYAIDELVIAQLTNPSAATDDNKPANNADDTPITSQATPIDDAQIYDRIYGIFSEVDGLSSVKVTVNQGVVKLSGETANEKKATQAVKLANRISGVVTVEDDISRTLDIQDNVTPVVNDLVNQSKAGLKALPLLLVALLAFALVAWLGGWLSRREKLWQRITPNPFIAELLAQTVKVIFIVLGLILALSLMGAEAIIGTLLGGAGVLGIAVGFAVKDTIENYIASLMLSIRQPFRAKDHVVINDEEGIVVRLTSRATILMTLDGNHLRLPNSEVFKATILNYTKNPERRFTFELGVDANNDPLAAIKVGLDAIYTLDFVLKEPKAVAVINEVGDSNIILEFRVWVDQSKTDFSKARSIAIRETKHALENQGFSLPEPIYMLNFDQALEDAVINLATHLVPTAPSPKTTPDISIDDTAPIGDTERQKQIAKVRAEKILNENCMNDILDTAPDPEIWHRVEAEIRNRSGEKDLLSNNSPQE